MRFSVVTLFPEMVDAPLSASIVGRARERGLVRVDYVNPRDFSQDRHRTVDDRPYGGGPGMLMMAEPLYQAVKKAKGRTGYTVLLSPHGRRFDQKTARRLAKKKHLVLVCGHYEGVDHRIVSKIDEELSIGDFILTCGEIGAAAVADCVTRLVPGVFVKEGVAENESFSDGLLEAPQYTRPAVWRRLKVPPVLMGGNHKEIEKWRREQSLKLTKQLRPDLLQSAHLEEGHDTADKS